MHFYYSPGTCALATHIILEEVGAKYEAVPVDIHKHTYPGGDFRKINPKGYVPVLELDTKQVLTENAVIMQYLSDHKPETKLIPNQGIERYRELEAMNFVSTEFHKAFGPLFSPEFSEDTKNTFRSHLKERFQQADTMLEGKSYFLGEKFGPADAYFFVMTRWAEHTKVDIAGLKNVARHKEAVLARPSTQKVLPIHEKA